jgi:transposase
LLGEDFFSEVVAVTFIHSHNADVGLVHVRESTQLRCILSAGSACPPAAEAATLASDFARMVRGRKPRDLSIWIERASASQASIEIQRFAKGLQEDLLAVQAAFSLAWSNGQTEGQVNRIKLVKRQMYGRAKLDLLRRRVLARRACKD